jgi:hypothetical protein
MRYEIIYQVEGKQGTRETTMEGVDYVDAAKNFNKTFPELGDGSINWLWVPPYLPFDPRKL